MKTILKLIKKQYFRILLNLIITILFLLYVMQYFPLPILDQLENIAYDYRVKVAMSNTIDERIVIIDIDEKSLSEVGRWPWGRDITAKLTNQLFDEYGVYLVGFDIVFAEEDKSSGLHILNKLAADELNDQEDFIQRVKELEKVLDYDQLFLDSLSNRRVVLGYYFNNTSDVEGNLITGKLPQPINTADDFSNINIKSRKATGYGANLARFQTDTTAAGHFNPSIDADGIVRRIPILYEYNGDYYESESLSLSMVRALLEVDTVLPIFERFNEKNSGYYELEWLQVGDLKIPVDEHIQSLIPYRGKQGSFKYISAVDVLNGHIKKSELQDRIVLVGASAPGLFDLRSTPVQNKYPGVEIHANMIAGIIDESIKLKPTFTLGAEFIQILLIGVLLSFVIPCISPFIANFVFGISLAIISV